MKIFTRFMNMAMLLIFSASLVAQTTYYVSSDGDDDNDGLTEETALATLYQAIAKDVGLADSGDVVMVTGTVLNAPDSLEIDGAWDYFENGYTVNKILTIEGTGDDATVDVKARSVWSGVYCFGAPFIVRNLTFTNSVPDVEISKSIFKLQTTYAAADISFENCNFIDLPSKGSGGVMNIFGHNVNIDKCLFTGCTGNQGGVIFVDGNLNVGGSDGITSSYKTTINISSSAFINNTSKHHGGAICATTGYQVIRNEYSPIDINIINTTFYGNASERDPGKGGGNGGALFFTGEFPIKDVSPSEELSDVTMTNVTVVGNTNRKGPGESGGIKFGNTRSGIYELNNCLIYGNMVLQEDPETGDQNPITVDFNGSDLIESDEPTEHFEIIMKNSIVGVAYAGYDDDNGVAENPNLTSVDAEFGIYNKVEGYTATIDTIEFILDSLDANGIVMFNDEQLPYDFGLLSHLGSITVDQIGNTRGNLPFGAASVGAWEYNEADLGIGGNSVEKDLMGIDNLIVYPNPVTESSMIKVPGQKKANVNIYSITGAIVKSMLVDESVSFPANEIGKGLYILELKTETNTYLQKILLR